jgi:hypothetical protein
VYRRSGCQRRNYQYKGSDGRKRHWTESGDDVLIEDKRIKQVTNHEVMLEGAPMQRRQ